MIFHSAVLENFGPFLGKHSISFDGRKPGLWFMAGENKAEPSLGANGAGKSTIWNALTWCLYGKTLRGLKAGDIRPWADAGLTRVVVRVNKDVIERAQAPNALTLNGRAVEQDTINKRLRLSWSGFQRAVVIGQFTPMFLNLSPADKLTLFSEALDLDYWYGLSNNALAKSKSIEVQIGIVGHELLEVETVLAGHARNLEDYKVKDAEWKQVRESKKKLLISEWDKQGVKSVLIDRAIDSIDKEIARDEEVMTTGRKAVGLTQAQFADAETIYLNAYNEVTKINTLLNRERNALAAFPKSGAICGHCQQQVDPAHAKQHRRAAEEAIKNLEAKRNNTAKVRDKAQAGLTTLRDQIKVGSNGLLEIERAVLSAKNRKILAGRDLDQAKAEQRRIDKELDRLKAEANPFEKMIRETERALALSVTNKAAAGITIDNLNRALSATSYWVKGFKDIRLYILDTCLHALEIVVNNHFTQLGLKDWTISFGVERETKTGGVIKGFSVVVSSPDNNKPVPWEAWSGGESQRLQLATTLGLSEFLLRYAGIKTNLLVLDEPTQHLSEGGVADLVETLMDWAEIAKRQAWLVDHRSFDSGLFAGTVWVVKDQQGSHLEE